MKIVCDSCGSKYSIADDKVRGKVFKIRCKECDEVIVVQGDEEGDGSQQGGYDDEGYGSADAAAEWYAVIDGEQVGPITPDEVEAYYRDDVLDDGSYVWREGLDDWTPLQDMDEFAHLGGDFAGPEEETRISEGLNATDDTAEMSEGEAETVVTEPGGDFTDMFDDQGGGEADQEAATQEVSRSDYQQQAQAAQNQSQQEEAGGDLFSDFEGGDQQSGSPEATQEVSRGGGDGSDFESFGGGNTSGGGQSGGAQTGGQRNPQSGGARTGGTASGQAMSGGSSGHSQSGSSGTTGTGGAKRGGGAAGGGAGARRSGGKVGERSENSVLFSLDSVDEMQSVDDSESGEDVSGAGATTEGSGLIDIQNLAASHAAMKGDEQDAGGGAGGAAPGGAQTGSSPGKNLSTQSMQSVPNLNPKGSRQNNTVLIAAIIAGSLVLLGAIGVVGYIVLTRNAQPTKVVKKTSGGEAVQAAAAGEAAAGDDKSGKNKAGKADKSGEKAATAKANTDAGVAKADAGEGDKKKRAEKEEQKDEEEERQKVAQRDEPDDDRGARPAPDPDPPRGGGGGGGGGSSSDDDDIDSLLNNVGNESSGGGGGGSQQAQQNLPEKPSRDDVLSTIRKYSGRVASCASDQNSGNLSGTMKVRFQIEPSGNVSSTNIQTGKYQGTDVGSCVTGVIRDMSFPRTQNGMPVVFPFSIN